MKKKETLEIPDSIFTALGIHLPCSEENEAGGYERGGSVTEYLRADRVTTLRKEDKYQKTLPKLEGVELLQLNLPDIPGNRYQGAEYLLRSIRRKILKAFPTSESAEEGALVTKLFSVLTKHYKDTISIERVSAYTDKASALAATVLEQEQFYMVRFPGLSGETAYGTVCGGKKGKKDRYYSYRSDRSWSIHIINLLDLLAFLCLLQGIYEIQQEVELPLVQHYYEDYIQKELSRSRLPEDRRIAAEALKASRPIPLEALVHPQRLKYGNGFEFTMHVDLLCNLSELFLRVYSLYRDISCEVKERRESAKTIATAYITKKNIPLQVQETMKKTAFMNYFKYVEFDEETDLAGIRGIEKEFLVLNREYFHDLKYPTVNLRFRKLGKHKATGLYYPGIDTLCVDIRSPSSFLHEFFHMMDDLLGDLSLGVEFEPLAEEYKRAFKDGLRQQPDAVKEQMNGKTKYSKAYFFRRAEIFARCGEIYFTRILNVESSLIKPDLSFAYPLSESLDGLIKPYYENLLEKRLGGGLFPAAN